MSADIPLRPVATGTTLAPPAEAPYALFIASSLALALGGGFLLAVLLALAAALEWDWGSNWAVLAQAHGQLQLVGFGMVFTAGMAMRLIPRFSGRPLVLPRAIPWVAFLLVSALVLRSLAQPAGHGVLRDMGMLASAGAFLAGAITFAVIVWATLAHRSSRAEATGYFFCLGSAAGVAAAGLNLFIVLEMQTDGATLAPTVPQQALVFIEQFGVNLMFISGVSLRMIPTLTGRGRPDLGARTAAIALACGVAAFAATLLWTEYGARSTSVIRLGCAGLILTGVAFAGVVAMTGIFSPAANRVAQASRAPFWLLRSAMAWLIVSSALIVWYGFDGLRAGRAPDQFEIDAIRHALAIGVLTMMIVGVAELIVPEFAARRMRHHGEATLIIAIAIALNLATALRIWPAIEGVGWLTETRWWPMSLAGMTVYAVVLVFAARYAQGHYELRQARAHGP